MNRLTLLSITLLPLISTSSPAVAQQSTLGEGGSFAWAATVGWMELIPQRPAPGDGVIVTDTHLRGYGWSDSTGWLNFGAGTPANGVRYGNTDGADSGVNHDGAGNLSGLAWSANLGWINFRWTTATDASRPRFDICTGHFSGYAWSPNAGWITLGTGLLSTDTIMIPDSDEDGISDSWELDHAGDLALMNSSTDADSDGQSDKQEFIADTDPFNAAENLTVLSFISGVNSSQITWTSRPSRLYRIGQSTGLVVWSTGAGIAPDAGTRTSRTVRHEASSRGFFRVDAVLPLQK